MSLQASVASRRRASSPAMPRLQPYVSGRPALTVRLANEPFPHLFSRRTCRQIQPMAEDARTADALVFRARKRRRVEYPRRDDDEPQSEVDDLKLAPGFPISPSLPESHDGTVSAPESDDTQKLHGVLRPRKLKPRWQGLIASSHASPSPEHGTSDSRAIVLANKSSDGNPSNGAIAKRFTKQTGRTVNKLEEKHEYVRPLIPYYKRAETNL